MFGAFIFGHPYFGQGAAVYELPFAPDLELTCSIHRTITMTLSIEQQLDIAFDIEALLLSTTIEQNVTVDAEIETIISDDALLTTH